MDLVEIDPESFVTCRLCINEKGIYQIVPAIQKQIQYCFDIAVEPFDGLSQIICKNCKLKLDNISDTKRIFKENQEILNKKVQPKNRNRESKEKEQSELEIVSSSQQDEKTIEKSRHKKNKRHIKRKLSLIRNNVTTDDDSDQFMSTTSNICEQKNKKVKQTISPAVTWKSSFTQYYVCRYCNKLFPSQNATSQHVRIHKNLLARRDKLINKHCKVVLDRVDVLPNITGDPKQTNIVVLDATKLILDDGYIDYFKIYSPRTYSMRINNNEYTQSSAQQKDQNQLDDIKVDSYSDVTSVDESNWKPKQRKRRRLISDSSTDTLILGNDEGKQIVECNNDDSDTCNSKVNQNMLEDSNDVTFINSDENSCLSMKDAASVESITDKNVQNLVYNDNAILKLINVSYKKYMKKICSSAKTTKKKTIDQKDSDLLNRKVLSIGRKIMSKYGLHSTGLLKYLEYKNLIINWTPNNVKQTNIKESDYVRIMTKMRNPEMICDQRNGFYKIVDSALDCTAGAEDSESRQPATIDVTIQETANQKNDSNTNNILEIIQPNNKIEEKARAFNVYSPIIGSDAILKPFDTGCLKKVTTKDQLLNNSQLLNANPVAHPKQVPKKKATNELKPNFNINHEPAEFSRNIEKSIPNNSLCNYICLDDSDEENNISGLPVVVSATSLTTATNESEANSTNNVNKDAPPRIKCKPVSELMSVTALNNLNKSQNRNDLPYVVLVTPDPIHNNTQNETGVVLSNAGQSNSNYNNINMINSNTLPIIHILPNTLINEVPFGFVKLNTATMPNTITKSPFNYLKDLASAHNINFINFNRELVSDFHSLIKFKLDVKQNGKTIIMCLSLLTRNKSFCIEIVGSRNTDINVNSMTPIWQWEVLKAFHDINVIQKVMTCAERIGAVTLRYTKIFLDLLRSIELISSFLTD